VGLSAQQQIDMFSKPAADSAWSARSGDLQALLIVTLQPLKFIDDWYSVEKVSMPRMITPLRVR
jgi:hypothetical protein